MQMVVIVVASSAKMVVASPLTRWMDCLTRSWCRQSSYYYPHCHVSSGMGKKKRGCGACRKGYTCRGCRRPGREALEGWLVVVKLPINMHGDLYLSSPLYSSTTTTRDPQRHCRSATTSIVRRHQLKH
ncbi:hypothetical protein B296_00048920 [Ensete ventricosum]|uniref:Secreted protein n=1 Tax=Ensete ventricosum TaxID=4639 RepID=A0A426YSR3_ENSVE|nr:hypothetical protein B296_00048920 [Ensete ventricosum]